MSLGAEWIQIRSTMGGLLDGMGMSDQPGPGPQHEAVLNLVVEERGNPARSAGRRLPLLYLNKSLIFGDRRLELVKDCMARALRVLRHSVERPSYLVQACEIDGLRGLYIRDAFNRSTFRRRLMRHGMTFSSSPFAFMTEDDRFSAEGYEEFMPGFLIQGEVGSSDSEVVRWEGAWAAFALASFRLGRVSPKEFVILTKIARETPSLGAGSAQTLIDAVRSLKA